MHFLRVQPFQLPRLLDKEFTFPMLTYFVGTDRNGWNEIEKVISVYAFLPHGEPRLSLYYQNGHGNADEITAEVNLWNTDPKKFWIGEMARLYVDACEDLEDYVIREKERLKAHKKRLKKLQEKNN